MKKSHGLVKIIFDVVLWGLAHSPIFCISDDNLFASLQCESFSCLNKRNNSNFRISLINLMIGTMAFYFLSYSFRLSKFEIFHTTKLENFHREFSNVKETNKYVAAFEKHIFSLPNSDFDIERKKLNVLTQMEQQRKNTFLQKINISLAVLVGIFAIFIPKITWHDLHLLSTFYTGVACLSIYACLNASIIIWCSIRGNNIYRTRFQDLRNSIHKKYEFVAQCYFDWRRIRCEAEVFANYVIHLHGWIVLLVCLLICLARGFMPYNADDFKASAVVNPFSVITLNKSDMHSVYSDSSINWKKILLYIESKKCKEIIIIANSDISSILNQLDSYNELKVYFFEDQDLGENEFKVIIRALGEERE